MRPWMTLAVALPVSLVCGYAGCSDDDGVEPYSGPGGSGGAGGHVAGGGQGGQGWDPRFDALAEALQEDLAHNDAYGVSVAVMEYGEVTFAAAFGSKDPDGSEPLTPTTLMQIGSTTKQMTAVGLLRKMEAGLVSLDTTLEQALPQIEFILDPTWDDQITVRHLLSHQGGFYDYLDWGGPSGDNTLASIAYSTFDGQIFLMAPPGSFWNYSNPNFVLAGLITEELDSRRWPDIMLEDVFAPLGMSRTYLRKTEVEADGDYALSYGFGVDDPTGVLGPIAMADVPDPAFARPAGLVWTTPTQMMTWAKFMLHGDEGVLSDDLRQTITEEQVDTLYQSGTMHYGFGMFVERGYLTENGTWYQMPVWEHGGNTLSFTNILTILPDQDFALNITSSGYGTDFQHSVDVALETLVDLPAPSAAPEYVVDPTLFDRHVGDYNDAYNLGDVLITRQGDTLYIEMPLLDSLGYDVTPKLTAVSSEIFVATIDGYPYDLTFIPTTPDGDSVYMRNRSFVATRVPAGVQAIAHPTPSAEDVARWIERSRFAHAPGPVRIP